MFIAKLVNVAILVIQRFLQTLTLNVREYDSTLQVNKTPTERMFIWLRIIGVTVGVLVILLFLVFLAIKI